MGISKRKTMAAAIDNAAALIASMDLDVLFGDYYFEVTKNPDAIEKADEILSEAQTKLVNRIRALNRNRE